MNYIKGFIQLLDHSVMEFIFFINMERLHYIQTVYLGYYLDYLKGGETCLAKSFILAFSYYYIVVGCVWSTCIYVCLLAALSMLHIQTRKLIYRVSHFIGMGCCNTSTNDGCHKGRSREKVPPMQFRWRLPKIKTQLFCTHIKNAVFISSWIVIRLFYKFAWFCFIEL